MVITTENNGGGGSPLPEKEWKFSEILAQPRILERWQKVKKWFFLRESTYDMTNRCNIRCDGCYYYEGDKQFARENRESGRLARTDAVGKKKRNHVCGSGGRRTVAGPRSL